MGSTSFLAAFRAAICLVSLKNHQPTVVHRLSGSNVHANPVMLPVCHLSDFCEILKATRDILHRVLCDCARPPTGCHSYSVIFIVAPFLIALYLDCSCALQKACFITRARRVTLRTNDIICYPCMSPIDSMYMFYQFLVL